MKSGAKHTYDSGLYPQCVVSPKSLTSDETACERCNGGIKNSQAPKIYRFNLTLPHKRVGKEVAEHQVMRRLSQEVAAGSEAQNGSGRVEGHGQQV